MNQRSSEHRRDPELLKEYGRLFSAASELSQHIEALHPEQDSEHTFGFDMSLHEGVTIPETILRELGEISTTHVTFCEDVETRANSLSIHLEGPQGIGVISRSNHAASGASDTVVIQRGTDDWKHLNRKPAREFNNKNFRPLPRTSDPELHQFLFGLIGIARQVEQHRQASGVHEIDVLEPEIFHSLRELYTNNALFNQSSLGYEFATSESTHFTYSSNESGLAAFSVRFASRDGSETIIGRANVAGKLKLSFRKIEITTDTGEAIPATAPYAPTPDDLRHLASLFEEETASLNLAMPETGSKALSGKSLNDPGEIVANGPLNDTIISPMAEIALIDLVDGNSSERDYEGPRH